MSDDNGRLVCFQAAVGDVIEGLSGLSLHPVLNHVLGNN